MNTVNNLINVLIVEDESAIRNLLSTALETNGYNYETATNGTMALSLLTKHQFDIILLDLGLPDLDGIDIIKKLRTFSFTPIIVISARSNDDDKITALDIGADDYLTKPFHMDELLARVNLKLRKDNNEENNILKYHDIELDTKKLILKNTTTKSEVSIIGKEFQLLELLIRNKNIVLSKEQIFNKIWGFESECEINTLEAYISFIRKKLKLIKSQVQIKAIRGIGYRLEVQNEKIKN